MASDSAVHGEQPAQVPVLAVPGTVGECPSDGDRLAAHNVMHATREIIKTYMYLMDPSHLKSVDLEIGQECFISILMPLHLISHVLPNGI